MPNLNIINGSEFGLPPDRNYNQEELDKPFDYISIAQSRLTNQFSEKPLINAVVKAMITPVQDVETLSDAVRNERWIATAVGVQLDGCGYIVGESRQGRTDDEYRAAILFRIFVNTSNATPEDLIHGLRYLTSPYDIQYIEQYPATAMLFTDGPEVPSNIQSVIQSLSPAGISDVPVMVSFAHAPPFRFGSESDPGELFVNSDADYLTANGADIQVTIQSQSRGARLGGVCPAELDIGGVGVDVGGGWLMINSPEFDTVIESGYHLTGVY